MLISKRKNEKEVKVFLDSSVIIAGLLSFSGGSFRIIRESTSKNYSLLISNYVLEECIRILRMKYPEKLFLLMMLLDVFPFKILKDASEKEVEKVIQIINFKDAPILAVAKKYKVDYLITLDKKDFLKKKVLEFAKKYKISILTPKEFLNILL